MLANTLTYICGFIQSLIDICVSWSSVVHRFCVGIYSSKSTVNGTPTKDTSMLNEGEQKIHHY